MTANPFDLAYRNLVLEILYEGEKISPENDRTKLGYINKFNTNVKLDLRQGFPLLTTKKINYEAIKDELFFFLSGKTNIKFLPKSSRFVWKPWADKCGNLGPIYGKQLVDWEVLEPDHDNEEWTGFGKIITPYKSKSINQIQNTLDSIKNNPNSRRHHISYWNVADLDKMSLVPCHHSFTFNVSPDNKYIDCHVMMRSNDTAIGKPYNWPQYATLLHMYAYECKLEARYLAFSVTNDHIYLPHIEKLKEQINRIPYAAPKLSIVPGKSFWTLKPEDIILEHYEHHKFIKYEIAV